MASSDRPAVASGADVGDALRRRNVPGAQPAAAQQQQPQPEEQKKEKKGPSILQVFDEWEWVIAPVIFTALAFFTRLYKIGLSNIVTWDEAHFGKFGSHYLKREFYFDVHARKLLVGLSGWLAGYNGSFEFKSGETYPAEVNYTFMRQFNAFWGAVCVPMAYWTAKELHFKRPTVWLVTLMVLCENSYTTISRFILLDSMLLFGTVATTLCWAKFHNQRKNPFEPEWFFWLFMTGLSIGFVCSVKLVGLFVTALVGLYTIEDLWNKFGDTKMPWSELAAHFFARVVGLIILPFLIYLLSFAIHFAVLTNSGPGDAQMPSLFQANLRGTSVGRDSPLEVAYGSLVTIKNMGYGGGLLHSHVQTYPEGSTQQQVTCYHHKDANNNWFFYPNRHDVPYDPNAPPRFIGNGDVVRLLHAQTGRNLHSHTIPAPITKSQWEVSGYGNLTVGDDKDHWQIEVVKDTASRDYSRIRTLTTAFRLRHKVLGCYLRAGNVNLPQWGFKQIEVTCTKDNNPRDKYTHWNIEQHTNEKLPPGNPSLYKSPFFQDFIHLNVAMMTSNNALVPDPDKQDDLASKWWQWPILHVGLRMCSWDDKVVKYFLLGNPAVYWGSTASLVVFGGLVAWYLIRWQRGYRELSASDLDQIHYAGVYPAVGWFLHYLPFIIMARVTYVHHYYPALYFAILTFGFLADWFLRNRGKVTQTAVFGVLYAVVIGLYIYFIPICFGMTGPNKKYRYMKWFDNWRMSD
ncbi:dolichyl-phosphate-mannose-protein mannosyltransferase 2-like protein [Thermochaetoides thermophila DSM 1495]|uniref:Dolichyl-phosphate-mannose--protein mannosyltransferase n=1 Tax=Chaetomium thermophilum (strain DSM 1495 / CBS 144.50 / IMI 039719) TaxID=759272 RepID=G0S039_CHATD|nr:dolichyl-phosphate-mannose-protein mannosyltransferase 2-like protein [Thermochaetoides thermophila DSM 1495]EGS23200.1 dolichyl-phosphate-mannose-protein mannosyltransferase 2-like protein [Thermochaetoides thermophila DSM 1495]